MPIIPKKIHAIWLGSVLDETGRNNIAQWKKTNPNYQVNLWIDSSLYDSNNAQQMNDYLALQQWVRDNEIIICDMALTPRVINDVVQAKFDDYQNMLNKQFFDDEINGIYRNLAAASDILRLEILYQEGGIYIDAKDVFPNEPLGELEGEYGFYYHDIAGSVNNDILASVPQGTFIAALRKRVNDNYHDLYQNEIELKAHRNPLFANPKIYRGQDPKYTSTIEISGPQALYNMLANVIDQLIIPEANKTIDSVEKIILPDKYYTIPARSALSWFDRNAFSNYEKLIPILRNYVREHFNSRIDNQIHLVEKLLFAEEQHIDAPLDYKDTAKIAEYKNLLVLLKKIKQRLNALPTTLPMQDSYNACIYELTKKELDLLNQYGNNIISSLHNCSQALTGMEAYCQENIDSPVILAAALQSNITQQNLDHFVENVLDNNNREPNLDKLKDYGIAPNKYLLRCYIRLSLDLVINTNVGQIEYQIEKEMNKWWGSRDRKKMSENKALLDLINQIVNNFKSQPINLPMTQIYNTCMETLTAEQKQLLDNNIQTREILLSLKNGSAAVAELENYLNENFNPQDSAVILTNMDPMALYRAVDTIDGKPNLQIIEDKIKRLQQEEILPTYEEKRPSFS